MFAPEDNPAQPVAAGLLPGYASLTWPPWAEALGSRRRVREISADQPVEVAKRIYENERVAVGVAVDVDGVRGGGAQHLLFLAADGQAAARLAGVRLGESIVIRDMGRSFGGRARSGPGGRGRAAAFAAEHCTAGEGMCRHTFGVPR